MVWGMGFPAGVRRDFEALERRRMQAARWLAKGLRQSEVARQVGAHRQSVSQWAAELRENGRQGLKRAGRAGRKPRLRAATGVPWYGISYANRRGGCGWNFSPRMPRN